MGSFSDQVHRLWDLCDQVRPQPSSSSGQKPWPDPKSLPNPTDFQWALLTLVLVPFLVAQNDLRHSSVFSNYLLNTERTVIFSGKMQLNHVIHVNGKESGTDGHSVPPDTMLRTGTLSAVFLSKAQSLSLSCGNWTNACQKPCSAKCPALYSVMEDRD